MSTSSCIEHLSRLAAGAGRGSASLPSDLPIRTIQPIPWEYSLDEGRFTQIGQQIEVLLGYPAAAWLEPGFLAAHMHPEDRDWALDFCAAAAGRGEDHEFEYRMLTADGRTVWLRDYATVVQGPDGSAGMRGFLLDITEQKQVQGVMELLARTSSTSDADAFFQACVRNLASAYGARFAFIGLLLPSKQDVRTLAVWAGDGPVGNFKYALDGTPCKDILDLKKELIPHNAAVLYPDDAMLVQMGVDSYFGTPLISSRGEMMGLISVMDVRPMELTRWTAPILGVFASRVAVELERRAAYDSLIELNASLEQRVRARTLELEAANHELQAFAYSVSHDLRAPLRAIDGFSQALIEDCSDRLDEAGRGHLQRVRTGTQRMSALIDSLLRLSRITQAPLQPEAVDLTALAGEIATQLRQAHPGRRVEIDIAPGLRAQGDPGQLRILLDNLLGNAWKYTARTEAAHIVLDAEAHDDVMVFRVRDNGVGFDMKFADKLFGAFQRLHRQEEFEGTGIGLATARRIVHRHGGRVWAEAEPARGATFFFTLDQAA